jgi:hypothetical protein
VPLIYREDQDLRRLLVNIGPIGIQINKVWRRLVEALGFGVTAGTAHAALADQRVMLAFDVYIDSYFEHSDSACLLGLVGVLEVLKDRLPASDAAQQLIRGWQNELSSLDADEADSIRGSLHHLGTISVSRGIRSVVGRHLGPDRAKEAAELYRIRSDLVHEGRRPSDYPKIVRTARQLVMDLLAHIMTTGSL